MMPNLCWVTDQSRITYGIWQSYQLQLITGANRFFSEPPDMEFVKSFIPDQEDSQIFQLYLRKTRKSRNLSCRNWPQKI